jgi:serine/threonine-protein kinase
VPASGELIAGKYEVDRLLGVGGMGVVVAARHLLLDQPVAIKFMRGETVHDPTAVERFLREARAAVRLSSEHVAKVLDVGTLETGAPYMVMEYLAGVDLGQMLRENGPMSVGEALVALLQASEAIAEAHALGIVHRDLKPSNLFVTRRADGTALIKVLDFGISKVNDPIPSVHGSALTASGAIMGSPAYMSPEQVRNAKAVDARTDIWALGVIAYELLSGQPPFAGETLGETFAKIISEPPPPIGAHRPDLPGGLVDVLMKCLERDVTRRVQTVAALATDLAAFAPAEAAVSIQRILRTSAFRSSGTLAAPSDLGRFSTRSPGGDDSAGGTAPPWLTSAARLPAVIRRRRGARLALAGFAGIVMLIATAATVATLHRGKSPASVVSTVGNGTSNQGIGSLGLLPGESAATTNPAADASRGPPSESPVPSEAPLRPLGAPVAEPVSPALVRAQTAGHPLGRHAPASTVVGPVDAPTAPASAPKEIATTPLDSDPFSRLQRK